MQEEASLTVSSRPGAPLLRHASADLLRVSCESSRRRALLGHTDRRRRRHHHHRHRHRHRHHHRHHHRRLAHRPIASHEPEDPQYLPTKPV